MPVFYSIFIRFYNLGVHFAALFNKKAGKWVNGRKNWAENLSTQIVKNHSYCWIHCASAGEFEQAIPLINTIRIQEPGIRITVSFFSPSGFELYKDSGLADLFFYLPVDTCQNAQKLVDILHPNFVIFIRNEIWLNVLTVLKEKNIPAFLVNANLEQKRNFFYRNYLEKAYSLFTKIFDTKTYGSTKLEKVIENEHSMKRDELLEDFCKDSFVIILGSSWLEEERFIVDFYNNNKLKFPALKIIIAPHENLSINSVELKKSYGDALTFYSAYKGGNILILNRYGILKYAYRYADIAFIGGGFDKGVHNITEAAVYGIPTVFGPTYHKFEEVTELVDLHVAFPVNNYQELEKKLIELMTDPGKRFSIKNSLENYFATQENSSELIVTEIKKVILQ